MTSRDFVFWLQGYFEVADPTTIGEKETEMIKNHLNLVFKHEIDPSMGGPEHQKELNAIHKPQTFGDHSHLNNHGNKDELLRC